MEETAAVPKAFPAIQHVPPQKIGKLLGERTAKIFIGALATPVEFLVGLGKVIAYTAILAKKTIAHAVSESGRASASVTTKDIHPAATPMMVEGSSSCAVEKGIQQEWSVSVQDIVRKMRIASLQMIPVIGTQLAFQYRATGSVKGFLDAPAVVGLLRNVGISSLPAIYGIRNTPSLTLSFKTKASQKDLLYYGILAPSIEETIVHINEAIQGFPKPLVYVDDKSVCVRIPVQTKDGTLRYHDGTFLLSGDPKLDRPTVVIYHGNKEHRDNNFDIAAKYMSKGYNVLLASYAGDHVIQGKGKDKGYSDVSTSCSEQAMREDAQADAEFLASLGVRHVSTYGYSLGGGQSMNFAQVVGERTALSMDSVVLDRTFTSMPEVAENVARKVKLPSFLVTFAGDLIRRHLATDQPGPECDGLDNVLKLREAYKMVPFQQTKFLFWEASDDFFMRGLPAKPSKEDVEVIVGEGDTHCGERKELKGLVDFLEKKRSRSDS
jgi:hypothetical protein